MSTKMCRRGDAQLLCEDAEIALRRVSFSGRLDERIYGKAFPIVLRCFRVVPLTSQVSTCQVLLRACEPQVPSCFGVGHKLKRVSWEETPGLYQFLLYNVQWYHDPISDRHIKDNILDLNVYPTSTQHYDKLGHGHLSFRPLLLPTGGIERYNRST